MDNTGADTRPDPITSSKDGSRSKFRQLLTPIYMVGLAASLLNAFGSVFVFDGDSFMAERNGFFFTAMVLPFAIGAAIPLGKRSPLWYALPIVPLAGFLFFSSMLSARIGASDREFCERAVAENNRQILDNPTLGCLDMLK